MEKETRRTLLHKTLEYFSRKFVLALSSLGGGFYLILKDKDIVQYVALAGVVLAFYNGANVAQDYVMMRKENNQNHANHNNKTGSSEDTQPNP